MNGLFNRPLRILLGTNALILVASATLAPIYALYVEELGGSLIDAGLTGAMYALAAGITTLLAGRFADRLKESELVVVAGYALLGTGYILYMVAGSILALLAVQVLVGFSEAIYSPAFDKLYSKHLDRKKAGTQWGAWESMNYFTLAAGAAIGGIIVSKYGFDLLFALMAGMCFISAAYIWFLPRKVL